MNTFRMGGGSDKNILNSPQPFKSPNSAKPTPPYKTYREHRDKCGVLGVTSLEHIDWEVLDTPISTPTPTPTQPPK